MRSFRLEIIISVQTMDPWSWTRQRGAFHFNFLPKIRRGSENSTLTAHKPATFSNEKRFFFLREASKIGRNLM